MRWAWELKSVNAKGLELRLRLPPGWDAIEPRAARARRRRLWRAAPCYANLTVQREGVPPVVRVNEPVLDAVLATMRRDRQAHRRARRRASTASSRSRA